MRLFSLYEINYASTVFAEVIGKAPDTNIVVEDNTRHKQRDLEIWVEVIMKAEKLDEEFI